MSKSSKVLITNKRTGKVSSAQTARSATQWKEERSVMQERAEKRDAEKDVLDQKLPAADQGKGNPGSPKATSVVNKYSKKKRGKSAISGLAEFISYAYSRKGQNLKSLAPGEVKSITKNARLSEIDFENLLSLSKTDPLLAVPRLILVAMQEIDVSPQSRCEVRKFIADVLKQHPVYQHNNLTPVIDNLDDALEPADAIRKIAKLGDETLTSLAGLQQPKAKDAEALRTNAINCLAMWLWESRGQQLNRIIRWLDEGYWNELTPAESSPTERLKVVTGITDVSSIGTVCKQFKSEADESAMRAAALQSEIQALNSKIDDLHQVIRNMENASRERDRIINKLSEDLGAERSAHANSRAHLGDDREHLRSNVVRLLKREVSLLTEGLQALRKEPPKVRVMDDHAERVLEGLQAAMKQLESED